jgi:nucleotide-binding universal stress UspA family protein
VQPHVIRTSGNAAEQILRLAASGDYDLIAIGAHRQRPTPFLGSVAREVSENATIPLLIVRAADDGTPPQ